MAVSLMLNVSQNIWNLDKNNVHAFVCHWAPQPDLFFLLAVYLKIW